ncbi:MAG: type II secretion system protein [Candidatus Saccharibacteria bacterium]
MSNKKLKGFTIIEVVLVLAIAGLIFLMVFIALPALQRSQKDTQRKNDLSRIMTQLTNYESNNRGEFPDDLISGDLSFVENYLGGVDNVTSGGDYKDPKTGTGYVFKPDLDVSGVGQVGYKKGAICGTDGAADETNASDRQYMLIMKLEGQNAPYCVDNR